MSAAAPRYLTKSRFQMAAVCPTKLHYADKAEYANRALDDSFLAQLAEGGYQVGELACLMHPDGVRIGVDGHHAQLTRTAELLKRDKVVIFEAAIAYAKFFVRVDILRKDGDRIELIEVKAKSYDAAEDGDFRGARGKLKSEFVPYLRDIAYQTQVARRALPDHQVHAYLMMADKASLAGADGINQRFKVRRNGRQVQVVLADGTDAAALGMPLLIKVNVDSQVDEVLEGTLPTGPGQQLRFMEAAEVYADAYAADRRIAPAPSKNCSDCQFRNDHWPDATSGRSGFHECWSDAYGWEVKDFQDGTVLDIWNLRDKTDLIAGGVLKPKQLTLEDFGLDDVVPGTDGMSRKQRQWFQSSKEWPGGGDFHFDAGGMAAAMRDWRYPLHFIDFETSSVALPFTKGRRPYEVTAFQFSHHVLHADGRLEHKTQWLEATPGVDPNIPFVRALRQALSSDNGTVFRWATHENTVLLHLREQIESDPSCTDAAELIAFIDSLTTRKSGKGAKAVSTHGERVMVDLCRMAEKFYFHPDTKGSSSLKKVLPALMKSSAALKRLYGTASYGEAGTSLNLTSPIAWWQEKDGVVVDPYGLLPAVFEDVSPSEVDALEVGVDDELKEGGAAMAAYARLQFEDLSTAQRAAICKALLRYCELDTLAMVMAVQAWQEWVEQA